MLFDGHNERIDALDDRMDMIAEQVLELTRRVNDLSVELGKLSKLVHTRVMRVVHEHGRC